MEDLFKLANEVGVTTVASSRSGATEVYRLNDGRLLEVQHLKRRDVVQVAAEVPHSLTVRYDPPVLVEGLLHEYAEG
jgi:hypothetical protein